MVSHRWDLLQEIALIDADYEALNEQVQNAYYLLQDVAGYLDDGFDGHG